MANKINGTDTLRLAYPKLNEMIDEVNTFQEQIDTIVIEGDSSVEAAQARVSISGETHTTLKERLDSEYGKVTADLAQKVTYKKHYLTEQGLVGDDTFRSISSVFPTVTLAQVQTLNPIATLNNSADWYIIQKLINEIENFSTIVVDGKFVVDLPLNIRRPYLTIEGKTNNRMEWSIKQIGVNQSLIKLRSSYPTFKNMLLTGVYSVANKTLHGIEIYGDDGVFNQSDHMVIDNCYIQNFGGSGLYVNGTHFILNKFKDTIIYNCYDNGVEMEHTADQQMNAMEFDNVSAYDNGLEYVNGSYQRMAAPTIARGHGMKISGTGLIIRGGDSSNNASAGIYIHDSYYNEGMTIEGRYFENNGLANLYSEGRKPINLVGNYMYPTLSQLGNIFFKYPLQNTVDDLSYELLNTSYHTHKPIISYEHTENKVVFVAIDWNTNEFISGSHGLSNGDRLYPVYRRYIGMEYPSNIFPTGIYNQGEGGYYVVNATTDRFKLSTTLNGAPITILSDGDVADPTKFQFEKVQNSTTYVTNMNVSKPRKIRAKIKGRFLADGAPTYILPVATGVSINPNWIDLDKDVLSYPLNQLSGDIHVDLDVTIDSTSQDRVVINISGVTVGTNGLATSFKVKKVNKSFLYFGSIGGFDGIDFTQCYLANGTTVNIYLDA